MQVCSASWFCQGIRKKGTHQVVANHLPSASPLKPSARYAKFYGSVSRKALPKHRAAVVWQGSGQAAPVAHSEDVRVGAADGHLGPLNAVVFLEAGQGGRWCSAARGCRFAKKRWCWSSISIFAATSCSALHTQHNLRPCMSLGW